MVEPRNSVEILKYVSSEDQLALGAVDQYLEAGVPVYGPTRAAALIETRKDFSARFNQDHNIPQPEWRYFPNPKLALQNLSCVPFRNKVIKGVGLAGGKAVEVTGGDDAQAARFIGALARGEFSGAGKDGILIQKQVTGYELSAHAVTDGTAVVSWISSADHKKKFDEDHKGLNPNTGGKGAIAPVPRLTSDESRFIHTNILEKGVRGLAEEGHPFVGTLYAGLMMTEESVVTSRATSMQARVRYICGTLMLALDPPGMSAFCTKPMTPHRDTSIKIAIIPAIIMFLPSLWPLPAPCTYLKRP